MKQRNTAKSFDKKIHFIVFMLTAAIFSSFAASGEKEFSFKNSYDDSMQKATCYIQTGLESNKNIHY